MSGAIAGKAWSAIPADEMLQQLMPRLGVGLAIETPQAVDRPLFGIILLEVPFRNDVFVRSDPLCWHMVGHGNLLVVKGP